VCARAFGVLLSHYNVIIIYSCYACTVGRRTKMTRGQRSVIFFADVCVWRPGSSSRARTTHTRTHTATNARYSHTTTVVSVCLCVCVCVCVEEATHPKHVRLAFRPCADLRRTRDWVSSAVEVPTNDNILTAHDRFEYQYITTHNNQYTWRIIFIINSNQVVQIKTEVF